MTDNRFAQKTGTVLVAHKSSAMRSCIIDVIRAQGFEVEGCDTAKDVLSRLEVENLDWVLVPLSQEDPVNAFHILDILSRTPERATVRVSFLLETDQMEWLPAAFELGLFNWFISSASKDVQAEEIQKMFAQLESFEFDTTLYSANLLRQILAASLQHDKLIAFIESLSTICTNNHHVLQWLVEAYFLGGKAQQGKKILAQSKGMNNPQLLALEAKYIPAGENLKADLGVSKVFYVDPDEMIQKSMTDLLSKSGVTEVRCFSDGFAACDAIAKEPPDLLIMEWKLPVLSGVNLIQRIRGDGNHTLPIVILSSLVRKSDAGILAEMSVANVIEKPFREEDVLTTLAWTLQQENAPTQHRCMERKIQQHLLTGNIREATKIKTQLEKDTKYPQGSRLYNSALFLFYSNNFLAALTELTKAMTLGADSLACMNLMGKCALKMRDFKTAIACMEKANAMSPQNIARMTELAESHAELGEFGAARQALDAAQTQDAQSKQVANTTAKVEIMGGDTKKALTILETLGTPENLIADLNNSAVARIRTGQIKDGINLYSQTLEALPNKERNLKARVLYNLSLAYARANDLEKSQQVLKRIPSIPGSSIETKSKQLLVKVEAAIREDRLLDFDRINEEIYREQDRKAPKIDSTLLQVPDGAPGQRCLHLIFKLPDKEKTFAKALLSSPPRFALRETIKRESAMPSTANPIP